MTAAGMPGRHAQRPAMLFCHAPHERVRSLLSRHFRPVTEEQPGEALRFSETLLALRTDTLFLSMPGNALSLPPDWPLPASHKKSLSFVHQKFKALAIQPLKTTAPANHALPTEITQQISLPTEEPQINHTFIAFFLSAPPPAATPHSLPTAEPAAPRPLGILFASPLSATEKMLSELLKPFEMLPISFEPATSELFAPPSPQQILEALVKAKRL